MAETITMLDIVTKQNPVRDREVVKDAMGAAPVISKLPSATIAGTTYQFRRRVGIPIVGPRGANEGVDTYKTDYEVKSDNCFIYNGIIKVDEAVAMADPEGPGTVMSEEAESHLQGMLFGMACNLFYGKMAYPDGFGGFPDSIGDYMTISADPAHNTTETATKGGASVWAVVAENKYLRMMYGNNKVLTFSPVQKGYATDANGKEMPVLRQNVLAWTGLTVRSEFALAHLQNVSETHKLTDNMLASLLALFPANVQPTFLVMNKAVGKMLQDSRSGSTKFVKGQGGNATVADWPTEYKGIPILYTDALLDDETEEKIAKLAASHKVSAVKRGTIK